MTHTSQTYPRCRRCSMLATTAAVTRVSMLLLFSVLLLSCVLPAMTSTTFTRMACAATATEPPRCHVDYSRHTGKTTSKGSWAGLRFHLVFTLGLCTSDPDDGVMSMQLNERHVNVTGRSGSVVMPHLGLVRFNLSAPTIGPQYFTSELCYSEVNCTPLCADAFMGHVGACKVHRVTMAVIIVLFWMVPAVTCIGFLAVHYHRKRADERQKALHQLPEVSGTSPAASPIWRPLQCAPSTPQSSSSSHAILADDSEASHSGGRVADLDHASEGPVEFPVPANDESLSPKSRCTAPSTTASCGLPKTKEFEMAALRAVTPPSMERPSEKQRHSHIHEDDDVSHTTTMSLPPTIQSSHDVPAHDETLDSTVLHHSTHTPIPLHLQTHLIYQLNSHTQHQKTPTASVQAAEEAARLAAEHEAEQVRVRALEEAARLRAELGAAEEDERHVQAASSSYNDEYRVRMLSSARSDLRMPPPRPFIGFSLLEDVEKSILMVDGLYRDGPAYQTGIRLGDVLLRIVGVYVDSIAKARQVVEARCRCGCVVPMTLATTMNQQYSVALWIMTVDRQYTDKPFYFDVRMHHRIESSQRGKRAQWLEVGSPSTSLASTPLMPSWREATPRRGSELRSSARSAFVATSYFSSARRLAKSESERPRASSSVSMAEEAVEAVEAIAVAPDRYTTPNEVRDRS